MRSQADIEVMIPIRITGQKVNRLLLAALEGTAWGAGWVEKIVCFDKHNKPVGDDLTDNPVQNLSCIEITDDEEETYRLEMPPSTCIERGLKTMAERYPKDFAKVITDADDGVTGDVFLQCCLFQEVA